MEIEKVLDEYRNGDEDKRLCLFLTYREFREEFSRIDQDKAVDQCCNSLVAGVYLWQNDANDIQPFQQRLQTSQILLLCCGWSGEAKVKPLTKEFSFVEKAACWSGV